MVEATVGTMCVFGACHGASILNSWGHYVVCVVCVDEAVAPVSVLEGPSCVNSNRLAEDSAVWPALAS